MEHMCSSRKDKYLTIDPNKEDAHEVPNSSHQDQEPPLFSKFPSPFFDDIDTLPTLTNNHTHKHHHSSSTNKPFNITDDPMPSESKRIKKRSVGKTDRHSKIHTAQGLRDRRMRLSLHIARKFFHLQDLLGFDKASKTIEWLFCKSNKAIKELADNFDPKQTNQTMTEEIDTMDSHFTDQCQMGLRNKIKVANNTPENLKEVDQIYKRKNRIQNNTCSKETRDQARARARERTRERVMVKELEKSNFLFGGNPKDEISKLGLGLGYIDNQNIEELGDTSSASESVQQQSSSPSLDFSSTHHLLGELQLANMNNVDVFRTPENYCTSLMNHNPPAGWLNSSYGFQGIPGGFEADSCIPECCNYGIVPISTSPVTGDVYEQNPSSFFMPTATNFLQFQSQYQGK